MNTIVIDHDGVSCFSAGIPAEGPQKDIPVANIVGRWFGLSERIQIHWVNYLKPTVSDVWLKIRETPAGEDVELSNEELRALSGLFKEPCNYGTVACGHVVVPPGKSRNLAAGRIGAALATPQNVSGPAEPPQAAACPGEIPTAELDRLRAENAELRFEVLKHAHLRDNACKKVEELSARLRNSLRAPYGNHKLGRPYSGDDK